MATTNKVKISVFEAEALKNASKTEEDKLREKVQSFLEEAIIECETQIAILRTSELPGADLKIKRAKIEVDKAKKALDSARFAINTNFKDYINLRNAVKRNLADQEVELSKAKRDRELIVSEIDEYMAVLDDLNMKI